MAKQPKIKEGDIIEKDDGWQRRVVELIPNYMNKENSWGVIYEYRLYKDKPFRMDLFNTCSEDHLLRWGKKL